MSLIWKVGLIIVSTFQGGGERSDELMQAKGVIAQLESAAEHRVLGAVLPRKVHLVAARQMPPVRSSEHRGGNRGPEWRALRLHILAAAWELVFISGGVWPSGCKMLPRVRARIRGRAPRRARLLPACPLPDGAPVAGYGCRPPAPPRTWLVCPGAVSAKEASLPWWPGSGQETPSDRPTGAKSKLGV